MNKQVLDISKIKLIGTLPINFNVYNDSEKPISTSDVKNFNYSFNTKIAHRLKDKLFKVKIETKIDIETVKEWHGIAGANIVYDFIYSVENLSDYFSEDQDGETKINDIFVASLVGIAFSTLRGLIIAKSSGTIIENAIFPIVDPKELF